MNLNSLHTAPLVSKPRRQSDGTWKVPSSNRKGTEHTVRPREYGFDCSCEDTLFRRNPNCKHVMAVYAELAEEEAQYTSHKVAAMEQDAQYKPQATPPNRQLRDMADGGGERPTLESLFEQPVIRR